MGLTAPLGDLPVLTENTEFSVPEQEIEMFDARSLQRGTLMSRSLLRPGQRIAGPALLEDPTSTLLVPAGWTAERDGSDNMILKWMDDDA